MKGWKKENNQKERRQRKDRQGEKQVLKEKLKMCINTLKAGQRTEEPQWANFKLCSGLNVNQPSKRQHLILSWCLDGCRDFNSWDLAGLQSSKGIEDSSCIVAGGPPLLSGHSQEPFYCHECHRAYTPVPPSCLFRYGTVS